MEFKQEDIDIRVIDQRIGAGVGGLNVVIRAIHKPTGIIVEVPRLTRSQFYDRNAAIGAIEFILNYTGSSQL